MSQKDVRWIQRFQNFAKAIAFLEDALKIKNPDLTQKAGLIQFFELSFELAWNTMKDFLENQGYSEIKSPRAAIKKGFELNLIHDGHAWIELMEDRNLTSHTYDEKEMDRIEASIRKKYYPLLKNLSEEFRKIQKK